MAAKSSERSPVGCGGSGVVPLQGDEPCNGLPLTLPPSISHAACTGDSHASARAWGTGAAAAPGGCGCGGGGTGASVSAGTGAAGCCGVCGSSDRRGTAGARRWGLPPGGLGPCGGRGWWGLPLPASPACPLRLLPSLPAAATAPDPAPAAAAAAEAALPLAFAHPAAPRGARRLPLSGLLFLRGLPAAAPAAAPTASPPLPPPPPLVGPCSAGGRRIGSSPWLRAEGGAERVVPPWPMRAEARRAVEAGVLKLETVRLLSRA